MRYGYARVSTHGQAKDGNSLEAQVQQLKDSGAEKILCDEYTGTKADRPQLTKLLEEIQPGDILIVTKLDRFARSATKGIELINGLLDNDITVHVLNMGLMDNTSTGKLIRTILLAFAEFERDMIVERTSEGKRMAKSNNPGFREGRPPKFSKAQMSHAVELLEKKSYTEVAEITGISKATLVRYKAKYGNDLDV